MKYAPDIQLKWCITYGKPEKKYSFLKKLAGAASYVHGCGRLGTKIIAIYHVSIYTLKIAC